MCGFVVGEFVGLWVVVEFVSGFVGWVGWWW